MRTRLTAVCGAAIWALVAWAADEGAAPETAAVAPRLVVFEFFSRPACGNCRFAAPMVEELAAEYAAQPVLFLEHPADDALRSRYDRWWAANGQGGSVTLPLYMADSGHQQGSNPGRAVKDVYRRCIEAELTRPARAEFQAGGRVEEGQVVADVTVTNRATVDLGPANGAMVHLLLYEEPAAAGMTKRLVRSGAAQPLRRSLAPGESLTGKLTAAVPPDLPVERLRALVLVDARPGGDEGPYDMLQAAAVPLGGDAAP